MTRIELPFPPSLNNCFENLPRGGRKTTQRYRDWICEALWMLQSQKPAKHLSGVSVTIGFVAPDKRKRDVDNLLKPVLDLLVTGQVIKDDSNKYVMSVTGKWLPSGPACVVLVTDYEDRAA